MDWDGKINNWNGTLDQNQDLNNVETERSKSSFMN